MWIGKQQVARFKFQHCMQKQGTFHVHVCAFHVQIIYYIIFRDSGIIYDESPSTEVSEKVLVKFLSA